MKKTISIFVLALVAMTLVIAGCQKQENTNVPVSVDNIDSRAKALSSDPEIQKELMFIKNTMGFDLSKIIILKGELSGDYSEVDGWEAFIIPKKDVQEQMEATKTSALQKHRVNSYMATSGSKDIRILSGVPTVWNTAIGSSRSEWNALGKTLTFNTPASGAYATGKLNVSYVSLASMGFPSTVIAATLLPSNNGTIGAEMRINSDYNAGITASQRKFVMAHELGHAIGFRHTDSYDGVALITFNTACNTLHDATSVLRSGTSPVPSWSSFSTCDADAFDWYYGSLS